MYYGLGRICAARERIEGSATTVDVKGNRTEETTRKGRTRRKRVSVLGVCQMQSDF